jgi:hypothetical protein
VPDYKPKSQFEQFVVDSFEIQTAEIKRIGQVVDAHDSDITDIDEDIEMIQKEMAVTKGKKNLMILIGGGIWSVFLIVLSYIASKMGAK